MTDFAGDDADGAFGDALGDAGDGFVVGGVAVQHAGGEVAAERHAGEYQLTELLREFSHFRDMFRVLR